MGLESQEEVKSLSSNEFKGMLQVSYNEVIEERVLLESAYVTEAISGYLEEDWKENEKYLPEGNQEKTISKEDMFKIIDDAFTEVVWEWDEELTKEKMKEIENFIFRELNIKDSYIVWEFLFRVYEKTQEAWIPLEEKWVHIIYS